MKKRILPIVFPTVCLLVALAPSTVPAQQQSGQGSAPAAQDAGQRQAARGGMPMMGPRGMPRYGADPAMRPCHRMGMPMHGMRPMGGQGGMMDPAQRREMMQQHRQAMEQRLQNIESLLQELVDLQKSK